MDDRRLPSDGPINVTTGSSPESVAHQRHDWKLARVSGPSTSRLEARPTSVAMKRRLREGAGRRLLRHVAQTMRRTAPSTLSGPVMRHVAKGIDPPTGFFVRQLSAFARSGHLGQKAARCRERRRVRSRAAGSACWRSVDSWLRSSADPGRRRRRLFCIVENDAECVARSGAHPTDPVLQLNSSMAGLSRLGPNSGCK